MINKGQLTSYISNLLLILIIFITTGTLNTRHMATTLSIGLTNIIIACLDLKHPRNAEEKIDDKKHDYLTRPDKQGKKSPKNNR